VDLIQPHHQELLLAGDEDHVPVDHMPERALGEKGVGEALDALDLGIVRGGVLIDRQEPLVGVEGEVAGVVVGEVVQFRSICSVSYIVRPRTAKTYRPANRPPTPRTR
jgi:hypothetical protein